MPVVPRNDPTLLLPARSSWAHGLVGGLVKKGLQNWVPQSLRGPWVVQDLLERRIHTLCLLDLLHRAAVITGVGGCSDLSAQDELLQRCQVGKALVPLDVTEDCIKETQRLGGEVNHVRVPRAVETRREQQTGVILEQHKTC